MIVCLWLTVTHVKDVKKHMLILIVGESQACDACDRKLHRHKVHMLIHAEMKVYIYAMYVVNILHENITCKAVLLLWFLLRARRNEKEFKVKPATSFKCVQYLLTKN